MSIATLRDSLHNQNVKAFLAVIRAGEGTADEDGYRRHFGGELFTDFSQHPKRAITKMVGGAPITSTAAGAYQFLSKTWSECQGALYLPDFSPASQDLAAVFLIDRRGALEAVVRGDLETAIAKCAKEWASLPGSPYGQPVKTMAQCRQVYEANGGQYAAAEPPLVQLGPEPTPATAPRPDQEPYTQESSMPIPSVFIGAAIDAIFTAAPKLLDIFKGSSDNAKRNVEATKMLLEVGRAATQATNEQQIVEALQTSPEAVAALREAVEKRWFDIHNAAEKSLGLSRDWIKDYSQITNVRVVALNMTFIELLTFFFAVTGMGGGLSLLIWGNLDGPLQGAVITLMLIESVVGVRKAWIGNTPSVPPAPKD